MKRVSLLLVLLMAVPALAATQVDIEIVLDGAGNFELWADATAGDVNGGISGFNLVLDTYVTAQIVAPVGMPGPGVAPPQVAYVTAGFTQTVRAILAYPAPLFEGMNTSNPPSCLYDIGILPGTMPLVVGPPSFGVPWAAPVLLATGVGSPTVEGCNALVAQGASVVNLFQESGNPNNPPAADVVNFTPEPATLALLGLGGLAILRRRR